ncbi:Ankyrin repeat-containing domain protein [Elaphomyces granulatus]
MPLSDLPYDIFLNIIDQLDVAGINALARTNRQIYASLNGHLYLRDVTKSYDSRSLTWAVKYGLREDITTSNTVQYAVDATNSRCLNPMHTTRLLDNFHIALRDAAARGYAYLVERLLKVNGINPNLAIPSQYLILGNPLILAARCGHSAVVELLLAVADIDPNVRCEFNNTPLFYACESGHVSIVKQLLARDDVVLNVQGTGATRLTPLLTACYNRHTEVINLLLAKDNIDVNSQCLNIPGYFPTSTGNTALMVATQIAAKEPSMEAVVKSLLARDDVDLNIVNSKGEHVLMYSVLRQGHDILKSLLDRLDVNINLQGGGHRFTALMWAVSSCRKVDPDKVKLLLDHKGIDVNLQDNLGRTALLLAASNSKARIKTVKLLLKRNNISINLPDNNGHTPLSLASIQRRVTVVKLLLKKKDINPDTKDNHGCTPLANVCSGRLDNKATSIVRLLLPHHTDPNSVSNDGTSVLAKATATRCQEHFCNQKTVESLLRAAGATG